MGVHGLTTFIEENPQLLSDFQLCNTKVVIDGNNLYHQLYYHYHVGYQYNGDYDQFSVKIKHFFNLLKTCSIEPIIVFDGGYETDDRKLNTTLDRARNRIHLAGFLSHGDRGRILPILSYETFRHVLRELEIPHVTCDFEADSEIVVLANDLNCPVISMDSDFYIFDVKGGYIPFVSINLCVQTLKNSENDSKKYLPSRIYFTRNLVEKFPNLNKSVLPLLATLMGNDFINVKLLEDFYSKLKVPKNPFSEFFIPKGHTKLIAIFNWLQQVNSIDQAVEKVLNSVKPEKRASLRRLLEKSITAFLDKDSYSSFNLCHFVYEEQHFSSDKESLFDFDRVPLPDEFCYAHRKGNIPVFMLNAVLLRRTILLSQVENMNEVSSYQSAVKLRQIIYGILTKQRKVMKKEEIGGKEIQIAEYDREMKNIKKSLVTPCTTVPEFGILPDLEELQGIDQKTMSLLNCVLHVTSIEGIPFPHRIKLVGGAVVYWIQNTNPQISKNHVKSLLVCILIMNLKQFLTESKSCEFNSCIFDVIQNSDTKQLNMVQNSLRKYFVQQEHSRRNIIDVKIVHAFSQFQACMVASIYLNQLLNCPVYSPNPSHFFNGTFLYNFCRDLKTRTNVDLFISEMLVKSSPLLALYNSLMSWILDNAGEQYFIEVKGQGSKRNKRQRKNKQENKTDMEKGVDESDNSDCHDNKQSKTVIKAACSLTNRFAFLELEDSD